MVAVIILSAAMISRGFYKLWQDLLSWMDRQEKSRAEERKHNDEKRDAERERQREWEERQSAIRDQRWQAFISAIQASSTVQDARTAELLERTISEIKSLTISLNDHDTYVRAKYESPTTPRKR